MYISFTHTAASSIVKEDVTDYVIGLHKILNTNLPSASFTV